MRRLVRSHVRMRWLSTVLVVALADCARPTATPATAPHPEPSPAPATAIAPTNRPAPASEVLDDERIEADVRLVVGGNFAIDHLGPDAFAAVEARIAAAPAAYARKLGELYGRSPPAEELPNLYPSALLLRVWADAPDETGDTAHALLLALGQLLATLDRSSNARKRALEQMPLLEALAGGIDRPFDANAAVLAVDRMCTVPTPKGHGLMVVNDCTCGERPVCRAELDGDRVSVRVRRDDSRAPTCDDCFASWSTCSLPKLRAKQRVRVTLEGRPFGELTANASGVLVQGVCLSRSP